MMDISERYIICFSGEIYNFIELKKELIDHGANFQTNSDTEIIIEGYKIYGPDIIKSLNGMFSFVIWDKRNKVAFVGRDRLGKKPFYYYHDELKFEFASSLSAIEHGNKFELAANILTYIFL